MEMMSFLFIIVKLTLGYGRVNLIEGQKVSFEIGRNEKGPQAKNVSAI